MSDKFKPWHERRPKKFRGNSFGEFSDTKKSGHGQSKDDRKQRRDKSWEKDYVRR